MNKMSKNRKKKLRLKDLDQLEVYKGLRKTWLINPETRVKPLKKKYNRSQEKIDLKKEF
jgi:hypothetical protein